MARFLAQKSGRDKRARDKKMIEEKPELQKLKKDLVRQQKKYEFLTKREKEKEEKRERNLPKRIAKQ